MKLNRKNKLLLRSAVKFHFAKSWSIYLFIAGAFIAGDQDAILKYGSTLALQMFEQVRHSWKDWKIRKERKLQKSKFNVRN